MISELQKINKKLDNLKTKNILTNNLNLQLWQK